MFYLREDVPMVEGHAIYVDSKWALTSISQRQFWRGFDLGRSATAASAGSCPSTSRTGRASRRLGKIAMQCSREECSTRCGRSCRTASRTSTAASRAPFLDPAIESRTPRRPPTSSRCWSTPPARGPTGPTRRPDPEPAPGLGLRAHAHRPATMEGANGRRGGPSTGSSTRAAPRRRGTRSGRCASQPFRPRRRWTACAGACPAAGEAAAAGDRGRRRGAPARWPRGCAPGPAAEADRG